LHEPGALLRGCKATPDELVDRLAEAETLLGPDGLHGGDHVVVE